MFSKKCPNNHQTEIRVKHYKVRNPGMINIFHSNVFTLHILHWFLLHYVNSINLPRTLTVALAVTVENPPVRNRTWQVYWPVWVKFALTNDNVLFHGSFKSEEIPEFSTNIPSFSQSNSSSCNGLEYKQIYVSKFETVVYLLYKRLCIFEKHITLCETHEQIILI